jgi:hypothetical protein
VLGVGGDCQERLGRRLEQEIVDDLLVVVGNIADLRRGIELLVPEQHLDHADVDVLFQEVGCEAVAQRMRRHPLGDLGHVGGGVNGAVELTRGERVDPVLSGKQPDLGPRDPPPVTQQLQQLR